MRRLFSIDRVPAPARRKKATQVVGSTCPNEPSPLAPFPVVSTHTAGLEPDTDTDASLVIPLPFNSQRCLVSVAVVEVNGRTMILKFIFQLKANRIS